MSTIENNIDISDITYTLQQKELLVERIKKLRKQEHFDMVLLIIKKYNSNLYSTTSSNSLLLFFDDLSNITYIKLDRFLKKIVREHIKTKKQKITSLSENLNTMSSDYEYKPYLEANAFNENGGGKIKYSNKEKHLIKKKMVDSQLKYENDEHAEQEENIQKTPDKNIFISNGK